MLLNIDSDRCPRNGARKQRAGMFALFCLNLKDFGICLHKSANCRISIFQMRVLIVSEAMLNQTF